MDDTIQNDPKQFLYKTTTGYTEDHIHALNEQNLNTLIIGDKISKEKFPMFNANIQEMSTGIDQINKQIETFNTQINLLNLTGDTSNKAEEMGKIVSELTNSRETMLKKMEQTSLVLKGTQFFNTTHLEDIALINDKGVSQLSDEEMLNSQKELFERTYGKEEEDGGQQRKQTTTNPNPNTNKNTDTNS